MKKYDNYCSHLDVLRGAGVEDLDNEFVMSGIVSKFSLQFELAWKLLKETLAYEGSAVAASGSPREILKESFAVYDFVEEDIWLEMLRARNDVSHVYNEDAARATVDRVIGAYVPAFSALKDGLSRRYEGILF